MLINAKYDRFQYLPRQPPTIDPELVDQCSLYHAQTDFVFNGRFAEENVDSGNVTSFAVWNHYRTARTVYCSSKLSPPAVGRDGNPGTERTPRRYRSNWDLYPIVASPVLLSHITLSLYPSLTLLLNHTSRTSLLIVYDAVVDCLVCPAVPVSHITG